MKLSRRSFIRGAFATSCLIASGCAARYGTPSSYLTPILKPERQNTVFHWVDVALQQIRDQRVPPPRAAYNLSLPTVAGFLAANGIANEYNEHFGLGSGPRGADPELAYGMAFATAAGDAFKTPFFHAIARFKDQFPDGESKTLAIRWGKAVGRKIARMRANDGSEPSEVNFYLNRYERRNDALRWSPTGPFYSAKPGPAFGTYARPLFPGHGKITPWTMTSGSQFRADNFYDPASPEFAEEFDRIRRLGGADSTIRTADEAEIALFWEDGPWGLTPPGHFMFVGIQVLQDQGLSFMELARTFALMGMTQCDASISAWDSKYTYDIIRPETAIRRRAARFGNADPRVVQQSNWKSYIPTPEFPAYTSGHSTFGAAGATLIALVRGSDEVSFSHESPDQVIWPQLTGKRRYWTSLSQMAEENGLSRLYGGVHWQKDHDQAMYAGRMIAEQAFHNTFTVRG